MLTRSCGVRPFASPIYIYAPILITAALSCCSDIANLSAHLHRLPTPPPYLRQMRLPPSRCAGIRWVIRLSPNQGRISRYQPLSFRAQNRGFCALLPFGTPVFGRFEHKIGVFVRFYPSKPPFSGISSTKSRFLCAFGCRNPRFRAFRAQNRDFW